MTDLQHPPPARGKNRSILARCFRALTYLSLLVIVLATIAYGVLRVWYPNAYQYKAELESYLSRSTGGVVSIGSLSTRFHGINPAFSAGDVAIYRHQGARRPVAKLRSIEADIELPPLLTGQVKVKKLIIDSPKLLIRRSKNGQIRVGWLDVEAKPENNDNEFGQWLLSQGLISLRNAHIRWRDASVPDERSLVLSDADVSIENIGDRHVFDIKANLGKLCPRFDLAGQITGAPFNGDDWEGDIDLDIQELDLSVLPEIARKALPASQGGLFSSQLHTQWKNGIPVLGKGQVSLHNAAVVLPNLEGVLQIDAIDAVLGWQADPSGTNWSIESAQPAIQLAGDPVSLDGPLKISRQNGRLRIEQSGLRLRDSAALMQRIEWDKPWFITLKNLAPAGEARNFQLALFDDSDGSRDFSLKADLSGVKMRPYRHYPGIEGLAGVLELTRRHGRAMVHTANASVDFPKLFRAPLSIAKADGEVIWEHQPDLWVVNVSGAEIENKDIKVSGGMTLSYPPDHAISPRLKLDLDFRDGNGVHAGRYYPVGIMHEPLVAWLDRSIQSGKVSVGQVRFDGPVRSFPFEHGEGMFKVDARIQEARLEYDHRWPAVEQADLDLRVDGPSLSITTRAGIIAGQKIDRLKAWIPDMKMHEKHLYIDGETEGPAGDVVTFLTSGPLRGKNAKPLQGWNGNGEGRLALSIDLPLHQVSRVKVSGQYDLQDISLVIPGNVTADGLAGEVRFTERSVSSNAIRGRMLGGPVELTLATPKPGRPPEVLLKATGSAAANALTGFVGKAVGSRLDGNLSWQGEAVIGKQGVELNIGSDMVGVASGLPVPLNKPAKAKWPLKLKLVFPAGKPAEVNFSVAGRLGGAMVFGADASHPLAAFDFVLGSGAAGPARKGQRSLVLRGSELNADDWLDFLGSAPRGKQPGIGERLNRIDAQIDKLTVLHRNFGAVTLEARKDKQRRWVGQVGGPLVDGTFKVDWDSPSRRIDADLKHLYWPDTLPGKHARNDWQPASLPVLKIHGQDTRYEKMHLGAMTLAAHPGNKYWVIDKLDLKRPDMTLEALKDPATASAKVKNKGDETSLSMVMNSTDLAATLAAFGYAQQMTGEKADIKGRVYWPGGPDNYSEGVLNANLSFDLRDGRILKVKPGLGRLLGALNLKSVLRRLKLDFSDVFEEGFTYDKISGETNIRDGNAYIEELVINGPAASIGIQGRAGLAARDYDLHVTVIPPLGGDASLVGFALGGPAAGVLLWLGDKVLKQPLGKLVHFDYKVTGTWDDPVVSNLTEKAADALLGIE